MRQYITLDEFLAAARESMAKMATYYNPDATSRVGSIRVASQGTTGSIAFKWRIDDQGVRVLDALVNFPALPVAAKLTRREAELWLGYACHEIAGHAFHTDNVAWDKAVVEGRSFARLVNGLEDARIEALAVQKVPGARARLEALLGHVLDRALANDYSPMDPANMPFTFALLGRVRLFGLLSDRIKREVAAKLTPASRAWFRRHLDTLATCQSTADVVALARVIRSEVTLPPNTQGGDVPEPPGGQGDEQQDEPQDGADTRRGTPSQDGDDQGGGEDVSDVLRSDDGDKALDGQPGDEQGQGARQEPQEEGQGAGGGQDAPDAPEATQQAPSEDGEGSGKGGAGEADAPPPPWTLPADMGDMNDPEPDISDTVAKIEGRAAKDGDAGFLFGGVEVFRKITFGWDGTKSHAGVADELKVAARLGSAKNRGLLRQILVANERTGWTAYERAGTLNPGDIARSQTGAGDVFRKRWVEEGISTTVSILVDGSSSMQGERMCYATAMAYVLADVTGKCGLDSEVAVFRDGGTGSRSLPVFDNGWRPVSSNRYDAKAPLTTRVMGGAGGVLGSIVENGASSGDSCQLYLVQERGERLSNPEVQDRFLRMFNCSYAGTPDFAGTMGMVQRLAQAGGDRKILFVVTDGEGHAQAMKWCVSWAKRKHDIDVIGVGIGNHTERYLRDQYRLWTAATLGRRCGAGGKGAGAAWAKFAGEALTLLVKQARTNFAHRRSA